MATAIDMPTSVNANETMQMLPTFALQFGTILHTSMMNKNPKHEGDITLAILGSTER